MWPLLKRDGLALQYAMTLLLWNRLIGYNPFRLPDKSFIRWISLVSSHSTIRYQYETKPATGCLRSGFESARIGVVHHSSRTLSRFISCAQRSGMHPCLRTGVDVEHQVLCRGVMGTRCTGSRVLEQTYWIRIEPYSTAEWWKGRWRGGVCQRQYGCGCPSTRGWSYDEFGVFAGATEGSGWWIQCQRGWQQSTVI